MTLRAYFPLIIAVATLLVAVWVIPATQAEGTLQRVSVAADGTEGDGLSSFAAISTDGRFVAFPSTASTLVANDTNAVYDIFVHDLLTGDTRRVSVGTNALEGNGSSSDPSLSADGDLVAFDSAATNFAPNDKNASNDVFLHKQSSGETLLISTALEADLPANNLSTSAVVSADGNAVAFTSYATDLISTDLNNLADVFVRPLSATSAQRVSVSSEGVEANGASGSPAISANGRVIAFTSAADNLIPDDTNGLPDIFVHNLVIGTTIRVSALDGLEANGPSQFPTISADGNLIAFISYATNLVPDDTNTYCDLDYDGSFTENCPDVFVYRMDTGTIRRVNLSPLGIEANGDTITAFISPDGTYIAFQSIASNLIEGDSNAHYDIFLRNLASGEVSLVSIANDEVQANADSAAPVLSFEGRTVAFASNATNLVADDTNMNFDVFASDRPIPPPATPVATPTTPPLPSATATPTEPPFQQALYLPLVWWQSRCAGTETEDNNGFSTANHIDACNRQIVTGSFPESLPKDVQDVYQFTVSNPGSVMVTLTNIPIDNNYELALYGEDRTLLAESRLGGNQAEQLRYALQPGLHTYYIQIYRITGYSTEPYQLLWRID